MRPEQLHIKLTELVKSERKITHEILLCIQQLDITKGYAELGYSSLFEYLVQGQKYSEGAAQRRISAARLLKEIPEMTSQIQEGKINLTQLAKLSVAVKQEQKHTGHKVSVEAKKEIITQLENKNTFETNKVLSEEFSFSPVPQEKVTAKNNKIYLTLGLTQEQFKKLQEAQMILSHSVHDGNYADLLETLCDKVIQSARTIKRRATKKQKPVTTLSQSAKSTATMEAENTKITAATVVKDPNPTATAAVEPSVKSKTPRIYISKATRLEVYEKAQHSCEYTCAATGKRCASRYQTQIDHIVPLAKGGSNEAENLRVLCRTHNLAEARGSLANVFT